MENQGLKLLQIHPKGGYSPFGELNNVTAMTYAIDTYSMDKSAIDTDDSSLYKNVLVVHFKHPDEKAEYDDMLKKAVKNL